MPARGSPHHRLGTSKPCHLSRPSAPRAPGRAHAPLRPHLRLRKPEPADMCETLSPLLLVAAVGHCEAPGGRFFLKRWLFLCKGSWLENSGEGWNLRKAATKPQPRDLGAGWPRGRFQPHSAPLRHRVSLGGPGQAKGLALQSHLAQGGLGCICQRAPAVCPGRPLSVKWRRQASALWVGTGRTRQAGVLGFSGDGQRTR